jgi:hypothetical protein
MKLTDACRQLGIARARAASWLSLGIWIVDNDTVAGAARELSIKDLIRLQIIADLSDAGLRETLLKKIAVSLHTLDRVNEGNTFLVISGGEVFEVIPPTERGKGTKPGTGLKASFPGMIAGRYVAEKNLTEVLNERGRHYSIVVNIDDVFRRVTEACEGRE